MDACGLKVDNLAISGNLRIKMPVAIVDIGFLEFFKY